MEQPPLQKQESHVSNGSHRIKIRKLPILPGKSPNFINIPKLQKGVSLTSLNAKLKKRVNPQQYSYSAESSFQEIARLISINDEQKYKITKLVEEIKTLKIVASRQERGLEMLDKEKNEYPKLVKSLYDELRVQKNEKHKLSERIVILERMALSNAEEQHKLHMKNKELKKQLQEIEASDNNQLLNQKAELKSELESKDSVIEVNYNNEDLNNKLKLLKAEKERENSFMKQKVVKLVKELNDTKAELNRVSHGIKEQDKVIKNLQIYSRQSICDDDGKTSISGVSTNREKTTQITKKLVSSLARKLSQIEDNDEPKFKQTKIPSPQKEPPVVVVKLKKESKAVHQIPVLRNVKPAVESTIYKPALETNKNPSGILLNADNEPNLSDTSKTNQQSITQEYPEDFE